MKPLTLALENFAPPASQNAGDAAAEARVLAYEEGFTAGWEEAVSAELAQRDRLRTDLDARLQDLSLTWREAQDHALAALAPLIEALAAKVLPATARELFGDILIEHFMPLAREATERPVALAVCPEDVAAVRERLLPHTDLPFHVVGDETLLPGQSLLRSSPQETLFDLDGLTLRLTEEIRTRYPQRSELRAHG